MARANSVKLTLSQVQVLKVINVFLNGLHIDVSVPIAVICVPNTYQLTRLWIVHGLKLKR